MEDLREQSQFVNINLLVALKVVVDIIEFLSLKLFLFVIGQLGSILLLLFLQLGGLLDPLLLFLLNACNFDVLLLEIDLELYLKVFGQVLRDSHML